MQVDAFPKMDEDATIRCAIQCLQAVTDFRGNEVMHPIYILCHVSVLGFAERVVPVACLATKKAKMHCLSMC